MTRSRAVLLASLGLAACASAPAHAPQERAGAAYADFLVGRMANLSDDHRIAADRYFTALERAPANEALLDGALRAALASGDIARARQAARMSPTDGGPSYAHVIRSIEALKARRWTLAREEAASVEGAAGDELVALLLSVWARAGDGEVDSALADLTPLAAIRPYGGLFGYQQALALDYARRSEAAQSAYAAAADGGMWLPSGIERHADLLVREGARAEALALLDTAQNRANPELEAALARINAGHAGARTRLTPARGAAIGLYGLAVVYLQERDPGHGLALISLALMLDPDYEAARVAFAQQQADLGHIDLARGALSEVASTSPYAGIARTLDAWVLFDSGAESEAVALLQSRAGEDARAKRALADMYRRLGRHQEAESMYSELIAATPDDWRFHFSRAVARERLGRWPDAEADLRRAMELSPEQPEVLNFLGYTWVDRGENLQEGLQLIMRAVALRPNSGAIIDSLGWAHYRLGDYPQALHYLERAVELEPGDPTLNDHLGDVYWRLGRRTEARFQWRRTLTLEPDDPAAIEAKLERGLPDAAAPATAP